MPEHAFVPRAAKFKSIRQARIEMHKYPAVVGLAVASKLLGQGHTLDDKESGARWVTNKNGEVIAYHRKANLAVGVTSRPWGMFAVPVPECHTSMGANAIRGYVSKFAILDDIDQRIDDKIEYLISTAPNDAR